MKMYLSSYKLGNETEQLRSLLSDVKNPIGYIPNALDFTYADPKRREESNQDDIADLEQYGATVEILDLKEYFDEDKNLEEKIDQLGGLYVRGGNTFVLRQAMKLSGFDSVLPKLLQKDEFFYIAYSAGVCVLSPSLEPIAITDDFDDMPYPQITEQIWEGLNVLPFVFEPHYQSNHPESDSTDKEIQWCIENKVLFKAYRDGEVLVVDSKSIPT